MPEEHKKTTEDRKAGASRGNIVKVPRAGEKRTEGAKSNEPNIEELVKGVEEQAGKLLQNMGNWVNQGDELIGKTRVWLQEHPVATAVALRYARKMNFVPGNMDEARTKARQAGNKLRRTAKGGVSAIRAKPMDALLIGAGLGLAAAVVLKNR